MSDTDVTPAANDFIQCGDIEYRRESFGFTCRHMWKGKKVMYDVYSTAELLKDWPKYALCYDTKDHITIYTTDRIRAARITAAYIRFVQGSREGVSWNGTQLHFDLRTAPESMGRGRFEKEIRAITNYCDNYEGPVPFLAEEVELRIKPRGPLLYLSVKNVLVMYPSNSPSRNGANLSKRWYDLYPYGEPAPGAREFLAWARENYQIHWLEPSITGQYGNLHDYDSSRLAETLQCEEKDLRAIGNPYERTSTFTRRTTGINSYAKDWHWLGYAPVERELEDLRSWEALDRLIRVDSTKYSGDLIRAWMILKERRGTPSLPIEIITPPTATEATSEIEVVTTEVTAIPAVTETPTTPQ
jgi:hypothetical protein